MTPITPMTSRLTAIALAALAAQAAPAHAAGEDGLKGAPSFVDTFEKLDGQRWFVSDGWTNGKFQNCSWSRANARVADGVLHLTFEKKQTKDRAYTCGEIQTRQRFGYGVYEARMKAVGASGFDSAFFSYIGEADKQPHDEIDFEVLGKQPAKVQLNQYISGKGDHEKLVPVDGGADAGFHDYAFVWEPERIRYYVDGKLAETVTDPSAIPTHAQKIFASVWASDNLTSWLGAFAAPDQTVAMEVDRIAFTALGQPCQFKGSVACTLGPASQ